MPLIDFILHIDDHLVTIVNNFGAGTYWIIFAIIFIETGLVIFPFLPGDSLIFAAAAMAANPKYGLNVWLLYIVAAAAAIIGDSINYEIGKWSVTSGAKHSWFNKLINENDRLAAEKFFERHGSITIVIGRFIPFIRTFVPFISGAARCTANLRYLQHPGWPALDGPLYQHRLLLRQLPSRQGPLLLDRDRHHPGFSRAYPGRGLEEKAHHAARAALQ